MLEVGAGRGEVQGHRLLSKFKAILCYLRPCLGRKKGRKEGRDGGVRKQEREGDRDGVGGEGENK